MEYDLVHLCAQIAGFTACVSIHAGGKSSVMHIYVGLICDLICRSCPYDTFEDFGDGFGGPLVSSSAEYSDPFPQQLGKPPALH